MADFLSEKEYNTLVEKVEKSLFGVQHVDARDIVNDVLLEAMEKGQDLYVDQLIKTALSKVRGATHESASISKNGVLLNKKYDTHTTTRVCPGCNEMLPVNAFYMIRNYKKEVFNSSERICTLCKECHKKRVSETRKKNQLEQNEVHSKFVKRVTKWTKKKINGLDKYKNAVRKKKNADYHAERRKDPDKRAAQILACKKYYEKKKALARQKILIDSVTP